MSSTRSVGRGEGDGGELAWGEAVMGIGLVGAAARAAPGPQLASNTASAIKPAAVRLAIKSITPEQAGRLRQGDRADGRASGAAHLQRQADEGELVDLGGRELLEVQVLDDRGARADEQQDVTRGGNPELGIL